jgi:ABC-type lipoprotein export system ATPase subunit
MNARDRKQAMRTSIGYIFQDSNLFEDFSAYDNLLLYMLAAGNQSSEVMDAAINKRLTQLGLANKAASKVKLLSSGERQRLTLARILLLPREIIFADEPGAHSDEESITVMKGIFAQLRHEGTAVLIATQDDVFDDIADCIYRLDGGTLQ